MKNISILLATLLSVFLLSCNQGTTTSLNDGSGSLGQWTVPGIGTTYYFLDTTGFTDSIRTVKNGLRLGGKSNVVSMAENVFDTLFYTIEPNGDISLGTRTNFDSAGINVFSYSWTTYPIQSRKPIVDPNAEDSISGSEHIIFSTTRSFVGEEDLQTSAGTFATLHARSTEVDDELPVDSSFGFTFKDSIFTDYWFSPQLGMYIQEQNLTSENDQQFNVSKIKLTRYVPR